MPQGLPFFALKGSSINILVLNSMLNSKLGCYNLYLNS